MGARFQAVVGPWVAQDSQASPQPSQTPDGVPERGGDETIEMLSNISSMMEEQSELATGFDLFRVLIPVACRSGGV